MILAIDEGTTSVTCLLIDREARVRGRAASEFTQHFPQPGWVEHDAEEIWEVVRTVASAAVADAGISLEQVEGIGITNQRESVVLWDRETDEPVHRAIVWQDRRTAPLCRKMREAGLEDEVRARTGLLLDPYFSASKLAWIFERHPELRARAEAGELAAGTIDSWLVWKLTGGAVHVTEPTNASRTLLYNIDERAWDAWLLEQFDVPAGILPEVRPSSEVYGATSGAAFGAEIPIGGMAGDQQAALYGQGCWEAGLGKNTYGTGAFLLLHTGEERVASQNGLLTTVACGPRGEYAYALEGAIFVAGAAVQWLRDGLQIIESSEETGEFAAGLDSNEGVYLVPAFTGLGAPHWVPEARGALLGITRGTTRAHVARASLEAMAYSTTDVARAMEEDSGVEMAELRVDGGAAASDWTMQFQADLLGIPVRRPALLETTAFGAAGLAGLAVGFWSSPEDFLAARSGDTLFDPGERARQSESLRAGWQRAIAAVKAFAGEAADR